MQILCAVITSPIAGRKMRCLSLNAHGTRARHRMSASTIAVTPLRALTAVNTSTPLLKAKRADTWLAPIISAIKSKVAKAAPESALVSAAMGAPRGREGKVCWHLSSPSPMPYAEQFGP